jgi:hypothetical protein
VNKVDRWGNQPEHKSKEYPLGAGYNKEQRLDFSILQGLVGSGGFLCGF